MLLGWHLAPPVAAQVHPGMMGPSPRTSSPSPSGSTSGHKTPSYKIPNAKTADPLSNAPSLSAEERADFQNLQPNSFAGEDVPDARLPTFEVGMPRAGSRNVYKVFITDTIAEGLNAYMSGDSEKLIAALDKAQTEAQDDRTRWNISIYRARGHIMSGRASDAEAELDKAAPLGILAFGDDLTIRSLRGDARLQIGDLDGAETDYIRVLLRTRNFQMPAVYSREPSNLDGKMRKLLTQIRAFTGLANVYMIRGDYEKALDWAQWAEVFFERIHRVAEHPMIASTINLDGDSYFDRARNLMVLATANLIVRNNPEGSDELFEKAEAFFESMSYAPGKVMVAAARAQAWLKSGNPEEADKAATYAVNLAVERNLPDYVWRVSALQGEVLIAQGKLDKAEAALERAQSAIEAVSGTLGTDRAKRRFGVGKEDVTYRLAHLAADRGEIDKSFKAAERGRARAFIDMLADRALAAGSEQALFDEISQLDQRIRLSRLRASAMAGNSEDSNAGDETQLLTLRQQKLDDLRSRDPELADALSVSTASLADLRSKLQEGEILVYTLPLRSDDPLTFLVSGPGGSALHKLSTTLSDVRSGLQDFYDAIALDDAAAQEAAAEKLLQVLQMKAWAGQAKTVYFVPSSDLFFIPWGTLNMSSAVAVLPTGGWLMRTPRDFSIATPAVVVGDPDFHGVMPQLSGARKEAQLIGAAYSVDPILGANATTQSLLKAVGGGARVAHFATHGVFNPERPLQSAIIMSEQQDIDPLTAAELFETPLPARLVVLSACETGGGMAEAGDDFLGLARSFYLAGAVSVVNSLWSISDEGTLRFMEVFHKVAKEGDLGAAWLSARDTLKSEGFPPAVYGAFVLGGAVRNPS